MVVALPMLAIGGPTVLLARQLEVRYLLPTIALGLVFAGAAAMSLTRSRMGVRSWRCSHSARCTGCGSRILTRWRGRLHPFVPGTRWPRVEPRRGQDLYRLRASAGDRSVRIEYFGGPGSDVALANARPIPHPVQVPGDEFRGSFAVAPRP